MLNGLMMDDYQLSLTALVERAERLTPDCPVVSRRNDGSIQRTTFGETTQRARRLATGLASSGSERATESPRCFGIRPSIWSCTTQSR